MAGTQTPVAGVAEDDRGAPGGFLSKLMRSSGRRERRQEKETAEEKEPQENSVKHLAEAFSGLSNLLSMETRTQHRKVLGIQRSIVVHYLLPSKSVMNRRNQPSKPPWTRFWKDDTSSRASGRPCRGCSGRPRCQGRRPHAVCPEDLQWDRV